MASNWALAFDGLVLLCAVNAASIACAKSGVGATEPPAGIESKVPLEEAGMGGTDTDRGELLIHRKTESMQIKIKIPNR